MIRRVTEPTVEPVELDEVKLLPGVRVELDSHDDDNALLDLITTARAMVEDYTRMSLLTQTWDMVLDHPGYSIDLPRPPLVSITGVYVTDDDGNETLVPSTVYRVTTLSTPGRIFLKPGQSWPYYTEQAGFRIRYVAGVATAASVTPGLRAAIKLLVAYLYANPGDTKGTITFAGQQGQLPDDVKVMLDPFKVYL